jgi:phosphoenolpyruvate-protein kinase (PTS system EI component)
MDVLTAEGEEQGPINRQSERQRFDATVTQVASTYDQHRENQIFAVLASIARDPTISGEVHQLIDKGANAVSALAQVIRRWTPILEVAHADKVQEVRAVFSEMIGILNGTYHETSPPPDGDIILSARTLLPNMLQPHLLSRTRAVIAQNISPHARSILAGEQIPVMLLQDEIPPSIESGTTAVADASRNKCVVLNPSADELSLYKRLLASEQSSLAELPLTNSTAHTSDGRVISLVANLDGVAGVERAKKIGLKGVGLVRTELIHAEPELQTALKTFPTGSPKWLQKIEDYHYRAYKKIVASFPEGSVTIRTFDDSADKAGSSTPDWLANRGIRQSLKEREDEFRAQARAILRVAAELGEVKVLFPMVNDRAEFAAGKLIFAEESVQLSRLHSQNSKFASPISNCKFGAMIETPAAAFMVGTIVSGSNRADFISIGTNDLVRYVLATDGQDHIVGHDNTMNHPAVIKALKLIVEGAREANPDISISVCGDSAARPFLSKIFVGLGIDTLSLRPRRATSVNFAISQVDSVQMKEMIGEMAQASSQIEAYDLMQGL